LAAWDTRRFAQLYIRSWNVRFEKKAIFDEYQGSTPAQYDPWRKTIKIDASTIAISNLIIFVFFRIIY